MNKHLFLLATFSLAVEASAQIAPPTTIKAPGLSHRRTPSAIGLKTDDLLNKGRAAESDGNLDEAERLFREVVALRPEAPYLRFELARIFDRQGRDGEAYAQYRVALRANERSWSSRQEDPRLLARYGDLALRFANAKEATAAYAFAATRSDRDDVWQPNTVPRDTSLKALRSAAHAAAAIANRNEGRNEDAVRELRIAVSADASYWVPHFYLAQYLHPSLVTEAVSEAALAERLAPSAKFRSMTLRVRKGLGPVPPSH